MDYAMRRAFYEELNSPMVKQALVERAARLAATPVPGTPKLLMKHRTPAELKQLEDAIKHRMDQVEAPLVEKLHRGVDRLISPERRVSLQLPLAAAASVLDPTGSAMLQSMRPEAMLVSPNKALKSVGEMMIHNPETIPMEIAGAPVPGATALTLGYVQGKRGIEKAIDKHLPAESFLVRGR